MGTEIDPKLTAAIRNQECILVIGPEMAEIAGLPTMESLLIGPAREIGIDHRSLGAPDIAEHYAGSHPKGNTLLKRQLKLRLSVGSGYKDHYLLIKDLPFTTIITLNYDTILEQAFNMTPARQFQAITVEEGLDIWDDGSVQIVKLLGSVESAEYMIVTKSEFADYAANYSKIVSKIQSLASTRTFMFIGFGAECYRLRWLLNLIGSALQKSGKTSYLIVFDSRLYDHAILGNAYLATIDLAVTDRPTPLHMVRFLRNLSDVVKGLAVIPLSVNELTSSPVVTVADEAKRAIIEKLINTRLGSYLSLRAERTAVDHVHHFELLMREDLLDYTVGDFFSIRTLRGVNVSEGLSAFLIYSESSEVKLAFEDCSVRAIDLTTGEPLMVEPLSDSGLRFTHVFRIFFHYPIAPGERFHVQFSIRLPSELRALGRQGDAMSISLVRIMHGVDLLQFSVALDRKPRAYWLEELTPDYERIMSAERAILEELASDSRTRWTSDKIYRISGEWDNPKSIAYFINYRFESVASAPKRPRGKKTI